MSYCESDFEQVCVIPRLVESADESAYFRFFIDLSLTVGSTV